MQLRRRRRSIVSTFTTLGLLASLVVAVGVATGPPAAAASSVTEHQPDITWGGRTVGVAVDPDDAAVAIAAAESGGLFKTTDGGATWSHLEGLPVFRMSDVEMSPADGNIVLVTAFPDLSAVSQGGIWRSVDGGATWTRPATSVPACDTRPSFHGISWVPEGDGTVAVATDCGVSVSTDSGRTWTHSATGSTYETSVVARRDGDGNLILDACGRNGVRRSPDGGATWSSATTLIGTPHCVGRATHHGLAGSPVDTDVLFNASLEVGTDGRFSGESVLYESRDGGANWTEVDRRTTLNRPPFVRVHESASGGATDVDVYWGDGVNLFRTTCDGTAAGATCPAATQLTIDHADQIDVAWSGAGNCPVFVASDGGVHGTADCGATWGMVGASGDGFGALQMYDMAIRVHPDHADLYFGTQDNALWASPDGGASWPTFVSAEGFFLNIDRTGDGTHDGVVTGVRCAACSNFKAGDHFAGVSGWNDPVAGSGNPFRIAPGVYLQISQPDPADPTLAVYLNEDTDNPATWVRKLDLPVQPRGLPQIVGPPSEPTVWLAYRDPSVGDPGRLGLMRIDGLRTSATPTVTFPETGLNNLGAVGDPFFGGYCNGQGTFVCPTVFGADPGDPDHVILPDLGAGVMRQTRDGGATWTDMPALTDLVTDGGRLLFGGPGGGGTPSQVHTIRFDESNPDRILIGTEQAGILASVDNGATWARVPGSEQVVAITDFEFDEVRREIYVATYGRGMWKVTLPDVDLSIDKSHRPEFPVAGEQLFYDFTVTNHGPDGTEQATVSDTLPVDVTYVTTTLGTNGDGCSVAEAASGSTGETVVCDVGALAAGESRSFTVKVAVHADTASRAGGPTALTNTATVATAGATDLDPSNDSDTDTAIVEERADLELAKVCDDVVLAGQTATCTVVVDNEGPSDARGVVVTDEYSSTGSFTITSATSSQGTCTVVGNDVSCDLGDLEASSTTATGRATVDIDFTANEGQVVEDLATVRADTPDPDATNDASTGSTTFTAVADLAIVAMSDNPDPVTAGTSMTWVVQATNDGPSTARNAIIEVDLPVKVTVTSVSTNSGNCTAGVPGDPFQPVTCGFDTMGPGTFRAVTVVATVDPDAVGTITASAAIRSDTLDTDDSDDLAHTTTEVVASADLVVTTFNGTPDPVTAGRELVYELAVSNNGPSTAVDPVLRIDLPAGVDVLSASLTDGASGTCAVVAESPDVVTCSFGTMAPGTTRSGSIRVAVASSVVDGATLVASATVSSPTPDPDGGNDTAFEMIDVVRSADLSLELLGPATYKPSTTERYTVTVTNLGPSDADDVTVAIQLPDAKTGRYEGDTGGCSLAGTVLTCPLATVASGESPTFTFDYYIQGNKKRVDFSASVASTTSDPVAGNNARAHTTDSK